MAPTVFNVHLDRVLAVNSSCERTILCKGMFALFSTAPNSPVHMGCQIVHVEVLRSRYFTPLAHHLTPMCSGQAEYIERLLAPKLPGNEMVHRMSNETMSNSICVRVQRMQNSAMLSRPSALRFCLLKFSDTVLPLPYLLASDGIFADI